MVIGVAEDKLPSAIWDGCLTVPATSARGLLVAVCR
jgi:hypothetical protein